MFANDRMASASALNNGKQGRPAGFNGEWSSGGVEGSMSGSFGASMNASQTLFSMSNFEGFFKERIGAMRPWLSDFFEMDAFAMPDLSSFRSNVHSNVEYYKTNYMVIAMVFFVIVLYGHFLFLFSNP